MIFTFSIYLILSIFISESLPNKKLQFAYRLTYVLLIALSAIYTGISFLHLKRKSKRIINFFAMMIYGFLLITLSTLDHINSNEISTFIILMLVSAIVYHENTKIILPLLLLFCLNMILNLLIFSSDALSLVRIIDVIVYSLIAIALSFTTGKSHYYLYKISRDLKKKSLALEEISFKDSLTGIYNRRYLFSMLENEQKRFKRHRCPFSIILMDIDHFKLVNDKWGHIAGDSVLSEMGKILKQEFRSEDASGRYGGEEFLIILIGTPLDSAYNVAERLRIKIENRDFPMVEKTITASFGVAEYSEKDEIEGFIARADSKLYLAKEKGRNRVMK